MYVLGIWVLYAFEIWGIIIPNPARHLEITLHDLLSIELVVAPGYKEP